jgi:short-subunit dehydrogenase
MAGLVDYVQKTAVITGASSGIGAEFGRTLARRGARVALVARRRDRLEQLAAEIAQAGGAASVHVCDVSQRTAVEAACRAARRTTSSSPTRSSRRPCVPLAAASCPSSSRGASAR